MALTLSTLARGVQNAVRSMSRSASNWSLFQFIRPNYAGVHVGHEQAMQVAAVWACIDVIASALASSDWNVYSGVRGADKKQAIPEDRLQTILNTRLNPDMTAQSGKKALAIAAVGYGNGYAEIEWDMAGRPVALWPIQPDRVLPMYDEQNRLVYRVTQTQAGGYVDLPPEDVFHVRGSSLRGFAGDDSVARAIQSIAMAVTLDQFSASYFANGTQLGGVLEYPNKMDDPTYQRTLDQWNGRHKGVRKSFRVGILEGGLKFTPISTNAQQAQMIEAKQLQIEEICRWFRVPPHKIQHLLRATNNNIEHQGLEFSRDTLRPWVKEIEQEADYKLVAARGRKFIELDVDWAEQGDYKSRAEAYQIYRGCGVFTVNQVLKKLGENTIGPEGDIRTMNGASVRLEDVGKNMTPAPAPAPALSAPDESAADDVAQAWLTSIYARVQRQYQNRYQQHRNAEKAEADAKAYAREQIGELSDVLGERLAAATAAPLLYLVMTGATAAHQAAEQVFEKEPA